MNRIIKFRGLRIFGGGWIYGSLIICNNHQIRWVHNPLSNDFTDVVVNKESVGQFTGLKDSNGNEIYEGDKDDNERVMLWNEDMALLCWCYWNEYRNDYFPSSYPTYKNEQDRVTITGNIHKNN